MADSQNRERIRRGRKEYDSSDSLYNIEAGEDDNLYTLPDNSDEEFDKELDSHNQDNNFDDQEYDYDDSDEEDDEDEDEEIDEEEEISKVSKGNLFALMFKVMSTPVEGWKELKRRHYTSEEFASGLFYPMIAIAAISEFAAKFYTNIDLSECLMNAVGTFVAFFFGYFTIMLLSGLFLPSGVKETMKKDIGKEFVMMNLSTLALFFISLNLCPMLDAVLVFLPIWTMYLIYKGVRILRVPVSVESRTKVILTFLIIGAPILWEWLMGIIF